MSAPRSRRRGRPRALAVLLAVALALASLLSAERALAHIVPIGLGMQTFVKVTPRAIFLEYNLGYSGFAGFAEVLKMETSKNNILEQAEIDAFMASLQPIILRDVKIEMDGKRLPFKLVEKKMLGLFAGTDLQTVSEAPFDTWWQFVCEMDVPPGEHVIDIQDECFPRETRQPILWFQDRSHDPDVLTHAFALDPPQARYQQAGPDFQAFASKAKLYIEFQPSMYERMAAAATTTAAAAPSTETATAAAPEAVTSVATSASASTSTMSATAPAAVAAVTPPAPSESMVKFAEQSARQSGLKIDYRGAEETEEGQRLSALQSQAWYVAMALALLWGALHALAPGHGKSMVAAYLLGTAGRVVDALWLGVIVTITHSIGNFVIAVAIYLTADKVFHVNPNTAAGSTSVWLEVGGGVVVFLMGVVLLYLRLLEAVGLRHGHSHSRDGGHSHGFGHHHHGPADKPAGLISLGFVAGLQPCTAGIALVFMSVAQGWLWKGLYLLLVFSLGLGLVIVAISLFVVMSKLVVGDVLKVEKEGLFVRWMPVLSAVALTAVGAWMAIDCLMRNKVGPFAHT